MKANYLASPPLVVAYAIAGRLDVDLVTTEPLGEDADGNEVFLQDVWPSPEEIQDVITESVRSEMFERTYADVFTGDENWRALPDPRRASSRGIRIRPMCGDRLTSTACHLSRGPWRTSPARAVSS